jgi:hypothetical protein
MSHSFLGLRVHVASSLPEATRASLYATEPIGTTVNSAAPYPSHSPRLTSERDAPTRALRRFDAKSAFCGPCIRCRSRQHP